MKVLRLLLCTSVFLATNLMAGVNLKNGNFYISYRDIMVPGGGQNLEISRTYNSQAPEVGWFGFGWGNPYETYLTTSADGTVVVHENGSGAATRFTPKAKIDPEAAAKKIVKEMSKVTTVTGKVAEGLISRLKKDEELRRAYEKQYNIKENVPVGTILYSNTRGMQTIRKEAEGYVRAQGDDVKEYFNLDGKLTKMVYKNGVNITLNYEKDQLKSIVNSKGDQLFFDWYDTKRVKSVWSAGDKKAMYRYSHDNLIESTDVAGNKYAYEYDANHNLTAIIHTDKTKMTIAYNPKNQYAESIKNRDDSVTDYEYGGDPKNPDLHYWTIVTKKVPGSKPVRNKYEYEIRVKEDGSFYTYRIVTEVDGVKTETIYSECCSLPLKIARGGQVTNFEYNAQGLLTKKSSTGGDYVSLEYEKKFNKISKVVNQDGWTAFEYDAKGNLSKARDSKGRAVLLIYDTQGRIAKMIDQEDADTKSRRTLSFQYNALGKPVEIVMDKVGKINVAYDNYGEIQKVESDQGHKMAILVTQAFQNLLSIVKPAGVNLSM